MSRRALSSLVVVVVLLAAAPAAADVEEPSSLASIGDSITRATNAFGWFGDHPSMSWSTGFNPVDGLETHYERLVRTDPSIWGDELNAARSGATMADAPAQAAKVVAVGADYVTILMGANDLCAPTVEQMTPVPQFAAAFERTLERLTVGLPEARILVASIPDLDRLASVYGDNRVARFVWHTADICPPVLGAGLTWADRFEVAARERAFNLVLAGICERYASCRFDGFAVNAYAFDRDEVSKLDYFHPSLAGQRALASITWSRSWWAA